MLNKRLRVSQNAIRQRYAPHFAWVINEDVPWAPVRKSLSQSTVALVSTCGLYRSDTQLPFDAWNDLGDPSFREIHVDTPRDRLRITHTHYDHVYVAADINVALPIDHFQQMGETGTIGALHPWTYNFMGFLPEPQQLLSETAPLAARRLRSANVDLVFLTPC